MFFALFLLLLIIRIAYKGRGRGEEWLGESEKWRGESIERIPVCIIQSAQGFFHAPRSR
jgi:hypothetical protein